MGGNKISFMLTNKAGQGWARHGVARQGRARQGKAFGFGVGVRYG